VYGRRCGVVKEDQRKKQSYNEFEKFGGEEIDVWWINEKDNDVAVFVLQIAMSV